MDCFQSAFVSNNYIRNVSLPTSLTAISSSLFLSCSELSSIRIPSLVTSINTIVYLNITSICLTVKSLPLELTLSKVKYNFCLLLWNNLILRYFNSRDCTYKHHNSNVCAVHWSASLLWLQLVPYHYSNKCHFHRSGTNEVFSFNY